MTSNLTQALRQGAEHALETVAEGWRELRSRAGGALTRFRPVEDAGRAGASAADFPAIVADWTVTTPSAKSSTSAPPWPPEEPVGAPNICPL